MKKTTSILGLILLVSGLVLVGHAENGNLMRVNVPFAFQVGKTSFPPGQYLIQIDRVAPGTSLGSRLIVRSRDGKTARLVTTSPVSAKSQAAGLSFRRYNDSYFLAKVNTLYSGCELTQSRAEKEMSARMKLERQQVFQRAE